MYRERKRYKPASSNFRRGLYIVVKVLLITLFFSLYQYSVAPKIEGTLSNKLLSVGTSNQLGGGKPLEPLLSISNPSSTLYTVDLTEQKVSTLSGSKGLFVTSDPRVLALRQFLIDYNSPMYPYAEVFVTEADKYGLDWRLVAAISGVESAFGNLIPYQSHNGWGWKGDPTRDWSYFNSWADGIAAVSEGLGVWYGGHLTPFEIEPAYCPPCGQTEGHPWANGVTRFMNEMDLYLESL